MASSHLDRRRLRLIAKILRLPETQLAEIEKLLRPVSISRPVGDEAAPPAPTTRDWPHAPLHRLSDQGTYIVTASTYQNEHHFRGADRLDPLEDLLLSLARKAGWQLEAWAVFSNHYHFVGHASPGCEPLRAWIKDLHRRTATHVNRLDQTEGRQDWLNYWETELTFEKS